VAHGRGLRACARRRDRHGRRRAVGGRRGAVGLGRAARRVREARLPPPPRRRRAAVTRAAAVAALARTDARAVARDPLLAPLAAVPPVLVTLLRLGLPPLAGWLQRRVGVDLAPYTPLLAAGLVVVTI